MVVCGDDGDVVVVVVAYALGIAAIEGPWGKVGVWVRWGCRV